MAENQISLYDYRTLLGVIEKTIKTPTFLRDTFFPTVRTFNTESIDVDIVDRRNRQLAAFTSPRSNGVLEYLEGYQTQTFKPGYIDVRIVLDGENYLQRAPGETIYDPMNPDARMMQDLQRSLSRLDEKISRREEWMAAKAITTGKIEFKGRNVNAVLDFWKDIDAAKRPTTAVSTTWGTSGAKPFDDLRSVFDTVGANSGLTPSRLICGAKAWQALLGYLLDEGSGRMDIRRIDLGSISPRELPNGVSFKGHLLEPALDVYTYSGSYEDASGTLKPFIPDDVAIMICDGAQTLRAYGMCRMMDEQGVTRYVAAPRVPCSWVQRENPSGRIVQVQSRPLMLVGEPQAFHVITGLA